MSEVERSCGACEHYETIGVNQGICRCVPPSVQFVPIRGANGAMGIQKMSGYPPIQKEDRGCGEYEQKEQIIDNEG